MQEQKNKIFLASIVSNVTYKNFNSKQAFLGLKISISNICLDMDSVFKRIEQAINN